jgi:hypothetical protein
MDGKVYHIKNRNIIAEIILFIIFIPFFIVGIITILTGFVWSIDKLKERYLTWTYSVLEISVHVVFAIGLMLACCFFLQILINDYRKLYLRIGISDAGIEFENRYKNRYKIHLDKIIFGWKNSKGIYLIWLLNENVFTYLYRSNEFGSDAIDEIEVLLNRTERLIADEKGISKTIHKYRLDHIFRNNRFEKYIHKMGPDPNVIDIHLKERPKKSYNFILRYIIYVSFWILINVFMWIMLQERTMGIWLTIGFISWFGGWTVVIIQMMRYNYQKHKHIKASENDTH